MRSEFTLPRGGLRGATRDPRAAVAPVAIAVWVLALALASASAVASAASGGTDGRAWSELTPVQRSALAPLREQWRSMDPEQQRKWLQIADRAPRMANAERARLEERMARWARMSPEERSGARRRFLEAQQLRPEGRDRQWQAYQALTPAERLELQQRAAIVRQPPPASARRSDPSKRNVVDPPAPVSLRPVAPAVVQVRPGASTAPITRPRLPPLHHQAGLPKIAATADFVDPVTLLPRRGAQAAASSVRREATSPP